jgi:hypothetical protein
LTRYGARRITPELWALAFALIVVMSPRSARAQPATPAVSPTLATVHGTRDLVAEVIPSPATSAPGNVVRVIYSVINYEEVAVRVRLHAVLPSNWRLHDGTFQDGEYAIDALDEIDGEFLVVVAKDATPGERQLVKLHAEIIGEAGVYEGQNFVSIGRTGGLKPGAVGLTGNTTIGISRLDTRGSIAARPAAGIALSGKLSKDTTVSLSAGRDVTENLSNHRYNFEHLKVSGSVKRGAVEASIGNTILSSGNAIAGPFVRGRGGQIRKMAGRFLFDATIAQPTTHDGDARGRLLRGRAGINHASGSLSVVISEFSRASGYTALGPVVTVLDPDEADRNEIERRLAAGATHNRVFGTGLDGEWRAKNVHRLSARVGVLHLANAAGLRRTAPSGELSYHLNTTSATLNVRWRDMPPSLQGVQIGGDETSLDGSVRAYRDLRLVAQAFRSAYDVSGHAYSSLSNGAAIGVRFTRGASRVEVRGNYRESAYDTTTIRRTAAVYAGAPLGLFSLNAAAEIGETETARGVQPLAFYRGDMRTEGDWGMVAIGFSQLTNGAQSPQRRIDLLASVKFREYGVSGGAWLTQGYALGGSPGAWASIMIPTALGLSTIIGVEYAPITYTAPAAFRGSFMLRRAVVLPLGFLAPTSRPQ